MRAIMTGIVGLGLGLFLGCMPKDLEDLSPFPCADSGDCPKGFVCTFEGCLEECPSSFNGVCEEGTFCAPGTDWADCGSGNNWCDLSFNGLCEEGTLCAPPTDQSDCRGACVTTGDTCSVNGDCCDFDSGGALCVNFLNTDVLCSARCTYDFDCFTGCCVDLDSGSRACAPESVCAGRDPTDPLPLEMAQPAG